MTEEKRVVLLPFEGFYNTYHEKELTNAVRSVIGDDSGAVNEGLFDRALMLIDWGRVQEEYCRAWIGYFNKVTSLNVEFEKLISPKYYNYENDRLFGYVSENELNRIMDDLDFKFLRGEASDWFTSRSGFVSHYNPDYTLWDPFPDWDHNQLGCLLSAWIKQGGFDEILEDWVILSDELSGELYQIIGDHLGGASFDDFWKAVEDWRSGKEIEL